MKIDHININTNNLSQSLNFYQEIFGLPMKDDHTSDKDQPWAIIGENDRFFMAIYQDSADLGQQNRINHFGVYVANFQDFYQRVKKSGIKINLYNGQEIIDYPRSQSFYIQDPDGNEIEISSQFGGAL
jgi:catechol 2,3-dioxygenase-like lactoylglutathione lyase family enzyme